MEIILIVLVAFGFVAWLMSWGVRLLWIAGLVAAIWCLIHKKEGVRWTLKSWFR